VKWLINGRPAELPQGQEIAIEDLTDRLVVRSADGVHTAVAVRDAGKTFVSFRGRTYTIERATQSRVGQTVASGQFSAPMPGVVIDVLVKDGGRVIAGQKLIILEAMKTQQPIVAPFEGTVANLKVIRGEQVTEGQPLVQVNPDPA